MNFGSPSLATAAIIGDCQPNSNLYKFVINSF